MSIFRSITTAGIMLALGGAGVAALADEVFSGVAGYSTASVPAGRDVYVSVPITPEIPVLGTVTLVGTLDGAGNHRISIEGLSGLTDDELVAEHSVRVFEGTDAGIRFSIVDNDADSLLVAFGGNAPSPGTMVAVEKSWTLDSLFPPATQAVFHPSNGKFATGRKSELLVVASRSSGGLAAAAKVYFLDDGDWIESGDPFRVAGGDQIAADAALVIRHPTGVSASTWEVAGIGYHGPVVTRLEPVAGTTGSASLGLLKQGGAALGSLGLSEDHFRSSGDLTPENRTDVLHVFSLTRANSPEPANSYFRSGGSWRSIEAGNSLSDDAEIPAGSVLFIESVSPAEAGRSDWDQTGGSGN